MIIKHREDQVIETMKIWLCRGRYKRELEMIQELIEAGHEPLNIAAAALKIAGPMRSRDRSQKSPK